MENLHSELLDDFIQAVMDNQRLLTKCRHLQENEMFWRKNYFHLRSLIQDLLEKEPESFEES